MRGSSVFAKRRHDLFHLRESMAHSFMSLYDKVGQFSLVHIRELAGKNPVEQIFAHARARKHTAALQLGSARGKARQRLSLDKQMAS